MASDESIAEIYAEINQDIEAVADAYIEKLDNLENGEEAGVVRKQLLAVKKEMKKRTEVMKKLLQQVDSFTDSKGDNRMSSLRKVLKSVQLKKAVEEEHVKYRLKLTGIMNGHIDYSTITDETEFHQISNKSENVVCHFYRTSSVQCAIVDKHLGLLAEEHHETKFCKLDVEKAPLLCNSLGIQSVPTIVLFKKSEAIEFIVGFDSLGGVDDFSTERMEWRLGKSGIIFYDGDMAQLPKADDSNCEQGSLCVEKKRG